MNKKTKLRLVLILCVLALFGVGLLLNKPSEKQDLPAVKPIPMPTHTELQADKSPQATDLQKIILSHLKPDEKAAELVEHMTLEQKVGQLFMVGFQTPEADDHIKDLITNKHIGNVILFDRNMQTPQQVKKLNASLQGLAQQSNALPLLIGVDQEGGDIVRMREHVTRIPSQQQLGKGTTEKVEQTAEQTATELQAMGFNTNFAPVLDLSAKDSRSFGTNPETVYQKGNAVLNGFAKHGITGAIKHFPGNGRSQVDPHEDTSSVTVSQADLEKTDAYPFKQMIANRDSDSFFVMVTHIKYPAYDKDKPASLSPVIMQDVLRKRFGYKGIIVTDDFEMGAVSKYYPYEEIGVKALQAGADLILICHEYEHQLAMYDGVIQAVQKGTLKETRINEAAERIIKHKLKAQ